MAAHTKDELLGQLEHYSAEAVRDVLGRVSGAIGEGNAPSIDVEEHALRVTANVLHGRLRGPFRRLLGRQLAGTDELLWLLDAEDRIVEAVSPAAAASLGYEPDELVGRSTEQLRADGQDWEALRQELDTTGRLEGALLVRHKDGSTVPIAHETLVFAVAGRRLYLSRSRVVASAVRSARSGGRRLGRGLSDGFDVAIAAALVSCFCQLGPALIGLAVG
jgi:PAS domain S-box-containing protein